MTSISPPVNLPQAPNTASQAVAPSHSPSASASSKPAPQAAGSASAKGSYASATRNTFATPSGPSGTGATAGQHGKLDTTSQVNGRIPPAVPAVASPTIINGNPPTGLGTSGGDHNRKPSVTAGPSGASSYAPNGASTFGKPPGGSSIPQFGAMSAHGASPSLRKSSPHIPTSSDNLAVNAANPRASSPTNSPSPIPQPPASGGKPPSATALHAHNNSLNFGSFGGQDGNVSKFKSHN